LKSTLQYTGLQIDRADHLRRDESDIADMWQQPDTVVVPLYLLKNLIDASTFMAVTKTRSELGSAAIEHAGGTFLGLDRDKPVFAVNCNEGQAQAWIESYPGTEFLDLRSVGFSLSTAEASMLAYSRGISFWQQQNPFCALCGSVNRLAGGGHVMHCTSGSCNKQTFPRTDPAVIMLVERRGENGERLCLLGRSAAWPKHVYSTLAGFVETGESLEAAVAREVFEEAGIRVDNVRYLASQPWPFPQSIMLGFVATALNAEITIDETELADARWFSDVEIAEFGNWGDESDGPKLPRPDSIARFLIDSWRNSPGNPLP